jgi:hypothetical protein
MKLRNIITIFIAICLCGCDILEKEATILTEDKYYQTPEEAQDALNAVYGVLNSWQLYGCNLILDLNYNDDLCMYMSTTNASMKGASVELDANCDNIYQTWTWLYKGIRNANAFLENLEKTNFDEDGNMAAQARFLRAYYYFILAQNFRDVPLRTESTESYEHVKCKASSQFDVMQYAVSEMEAILPTITTSLKHSPSNICRTTVQGILARIYLYMAGSAVEGGDKHAYYGKARDYAKDVIDSGLHNMNPDYEDIFINLISDKYDTQYYESMWEADFYGDRSSPDYYGHSRWGELNGIRSSNSGTNFADMKVNFSYGLFASTIVLWDLYMHDDRVKLEKDLSWITDKRQDWNIPPFHYNGSGEEACVYPYGGDPTDVRKMLAGIDRCPWYYRDPNSGIVYSTNDDPTYHPCSRFIGKFRRETRYEGQKLFKCIFGGINVPLLRYTDVLMMYAEAVNEYDGKPNEDIFNIILAVRNRAGIQTEPYSRYSTYEKFQKLIRNERAREFCFEGIRKFDLLRWGIYLSSMQDLQRKTNADKRASGTFTSNTLVELVSRMSKKYEYLPIPSLELAVNTEMRQNPLW